MFGSSKEAVWRELCQEIGGRYLEGSFWKGSKVQARVGEWTITLDTFAESEGESSTTYTRLRAPYVNRDGFRFTVCRRGLLSPLAAWLGFQDIAVGHPRFDEEFVVRGNDEAKLRALFANSRIRELLQRQPAVHLTVKDDAGWFAAAFPEGVDELCFQAPGVIKDVDRLRSLYDLFAETLHHLCHIGSAYEDDPGLEL